MAIALIDEVEPKNGGNFAMVAAKYVRVDDATDKRLDARLEELEQASGNIEYVTKDDIDAMFLMADLSVTATAREGGQTVTVATAPATGLQRRYKVTDAASAPIPAYNETAPLADGWAAFPDDGAISGTAGQVVTVVDCTNSGAKVQAYGSATLPAPLASN